MALTTDNLNGNRRSLPSRHGTFVAITNKTITHRDGHDEIIAGVTRVDGSHEWVRDFPECFESEDGSPPASERTKPRRQPRQQLSLEQELRVRDERLRELAQREQERVTPPRQTGDDVFWSGVSRLLGHDELERQDRADRAENDRIRALFHAEHKARLGQISDWLHDDDQ